MPTLDIDFEVECSCGHSLTASEGKDYNGRWVLSVEPCEKCLDGAEDDGYEKGKADEGG